MGGCRVLLALGAVLALTLPGCGWEPLYADPQSMPASADLRAIHVDPILDRIGQKLEIALRDSLNPTGELTPPRYRLQTTLSVTLSALGIQTQGTGTLGRLDVVATYHLLDFRSGAILQTNTIHVQNSFALNPNQYSTVVGQNDAAVRSVAELNQEIVTRLNLFMEHRAAEKTPRPG